MPCSNEKKEAHEIPLEKETFLAQGEIMFISQSQPESADQSSPSLLGATFVKTYG